MNSKKIKYYQDKNPGVWLGFLVGILQASLIIYYNFTLSFKSLLLVSATIIILLIFESIWFIKKFPLFLRGVFIGSFFLPAIAFGILIFLFTSMI
jgi:hypothetical protein